MTDEQIAREFLVQARHCQVLGSSIAVLVAIIGEARSTERARCAAIVEGYIHYLQPGPVQMAARDMLAAIQTEEHPT